MKKNQVICGDAFSVLENLKDGSVDLVFADPPYFLSGGGMTCKAGKRVSVDKGEWDVPTTPEEMHRFNVRWLRLAFRLLKDTGSLWASGTYHNMFSLGFAVQYERLGQVVNCITWQKPNPPPNLACRSITHSTEMILWVAKQKGQHLFRYESMRREAGGRQMKDVWHFGPPGQDEVAFGRHPTQKPLALLRRIIMAASERGSLVLDPFSGYGTTLVAAKQLGREWIGIDLDQKCCEVSGRRLEATGVQADLFEPSVIGRGDGAQLDLLGRNDA